MAKTKRAKKMLVVEDQGETCLILGLILSDRKFEMDYVNNLLDADEYLKRNKPSVIILDNQLPDGARSARQAIAIGLSEARRAGVKLPPPKTGGEELKKKAKRDINCLPHRRTSRL